MTRIIALAGVAALLSGTAAVAQVPPPGGPRPGPEAGAPPPPPPGDPRRGPGSDGLRPPPPPSRAAHIVLERGDARVDVTCAEDDPTKACAEVTLQMLDKLATFRP